MSRTRRNRIKVLRDTYDDRLLRRLARALRGRDDSDLLYVCTWVMPGRMWPAVTVAAKPPNYDPRRKPWRPRWDRSLQRRPKRRT